MSGDYMKKILILIMLLMVGNAAALLNPNTGINWDKTIDHNITLGAGHYTSMSVGNYINTDFGLENNSTTGKIQINLKADSGLRFESGELRAVVGDGIDLGAAGIGIDPTDFIGTAYGLYEGSNDVRINLTANKGLAFGTGSALGSLQIKLDGTSLVLGAGGIKANETKVNNSLSWLALNATKSDNALAWLALNKTRIDDTVIDIAANSTKGDNALAWLALNVTDIGANTTRIAILENTDSHLNVVAGGAKGVNLSIPNIAVADRLDGIVYHNTTSNICSDVGAEFHIAASQLINNSGGSTNTTGGYLIVAWTGYDAPG